MVCGETVNLISVRDDVSAPSVTPGRPEVGEGYNCEGKCTECRRPGHTDLMAGRSPD